MDVVDSRSEGTSDFTERVVEAFFRRWYLYLLPIVVFGVLGVYSAGQIEAEYVSYGRLNATANPFVDQPDIRGTEVGAFETPAAATARLINEQLQTDSFVDSLVERANLTELMVPLGLERDDIRASVGASPAGQNNLTVRASWADPETALLLVDGVIDGYREYLAALAVADSDEAIDFWTMQKEEKTADVAAAEDALDAYLASLPELFPGVERPTEQTLQIQRLITAIDRAVEDEREAQNEIDQAVLVRRQAMSTSDRELLVVDEPDAATAPTGIRRDQLTLVVVFTALGAVLSGAALVIGTSIDKAVRTTAQLRRASMIQTTVEIPRIKELANGGSSRRKRREVAVP